MTTNRCPPCGPRWRRLLSLDLDLFCQVSFIRNTSSETCRHVHHHTAGTTAWVHVTNGGTWGKRDPGVPCIRSSRRPVCVTVAGSGRTDGQELGAF